MTIPEFVNFRPPTHGRSGTSDAEQLEAHISALRTVDYRCGGGMCREAVMVRIHWGHEILSMSDPVPDRLLSAVADLHNLAGWTCFDSGNIGAADHHFDIALQLAKQGNNEALVANIHYRKGRLRLHHGSPDAALTHFQLGQLAAHRSSSALASSILHANQAWAYAKKGDAEPAVGLLSRAADDLGNADIGEAPDWARFFTEVELTAMVGTIHTELACAVGAHHSRVAIPALTEAIRNYGPDMVRSRSFCLIMLATNHMLAGEVEQGASVGIEAVSAAETLKSVRVKDRIQPLKHQTDKHRDHTDARALSDFISTFITSSTHA
ncbi:transcriptional regulator [Kibdelosporangium philippinense]|uniref:Transcriptional regulator n=1 Tax=Kibdelosporangium philippinense TaxID=211113 RepID=A0ABS8ZWX1_9PSEU|nr:transcriptional regulator [Kibdelosporangium philippinense]MCE7010893.1 transcriptional regulator [Kibdelosporangium philippinense]